MVKRENVRPDVTELYLRYTMFSVTDSDTAWAFGNTFCN